MATATVTPEVPTTSTYDHEAFKAAAEKLVAATATSDEYDGKTRGIMASRFDKTIANYRIEGGHIAALLVIATVDGKAPTEEALYNNLVANFGVTMSLTVFNRKHRLHKAFVGKTAEEVTVKMTEYKDTTVKEMKPLDVKGLVSHVTGGNTRAPKTAEQVVASYNKAMVGATVDFTSFDDKALELLVKQGRVEIAHREWCELNSTDSSAAAHLDAVKTGVARARAAHVAA